MEGTWQETLSELGKFDCVFFDDYPGSGSITIGEIENSQDPRYAEIYMASSSHFHAFTNLCLNFHMKGIGARLTGYLEQEFSLSREDCNLVTRRIPVRPPPHCKYFIDKTAVVPLVTKTKETEEKMKDPASVSLPERRLCFAKDFTSWILDGKKRATTRVDGHLCQDGSIEAFGDLRPNQLCTAIDHEGTVFGVLRVTQIERRTFSSLDARLARLENFESSSALKEALGRFYKDLGKASELVVIYFEVVRKVSEAEFETKDDAKAGQKRKADAL